MVYFRFLLKGDKLLFMMNENFSPRFFEASEGDRNEELPPLLNEIDILVLERGLNALRDYLEKDPKFNLPDAVIFLDASARPLAYAVKPIIETVAKAHHFKLPSIQFMASHRLSEEEFIELLENSVARDEFMKGSDARAREIVERTGVRRILLVDEYLSNGTSLDFLKEAFSRLPRDQRPEVKRFVFCLDNRGFPRERFEMDDSNLIFGSMNGELGTMGLKDHPDAHDYYEPFSGFSYRWNGGKEAVTGVRKQGNDQKYVERAGEADTVRMKALRDRMREFGEKIARS